MSGRPESHLPTPDDIFAAASALHTDATTLQEQGLTLPAETGVRLYTRDGLVTMVERTWDGRQGPAIESVFVRRILGWVSWVNSELQDIHIEGYSQSGRALGAVAIKTSIRNSLARLYKDKNPRLSIVHQGLRAIREPLQAVLTANEEKVDTAA